MAADHPFRRHSLQNGMCLATESNENLHGISVYVEFNREGGTLWHRSFLPLKNMSVSARRIEVEEDEEERRKKKEERRKTKDERRKTKDERRKTKDERRKTKDERRKKKEERRKKKEERRKKKEEKKKEKKERRKVEHDDEEENNKISVVKTSRNS